MRHDDVHAGGDGSGGGGRAETVFVPGIGECPVTKDGSIRGHVDGEFCSVTQIERVRSFVQICDSCFDCEWSRHDLHRLAMIIRVIGVPIVIGMGLPVGLVEFQIVVSRDDELQLCVDAGEHLQRFLEAGNTSYLSQVAAMKEHVGFWCRQLESSDALSSIVEVEVVGVGDDEEICRDSGLLRHLLARLASSSWPDEFGHLARQSDDD